MPPEGRECVPTAAVDLLWSLYLYVHVASVDLFKGVVLDDVVRIIICVYVFRINGWM